MGDVTVDIDFEFTAGSARAPTLSVKGSGSATLPCTDGGEVNVNADVALSTDLLKLDGAQATLTFTCGSEPGPAGGC